MLMQTSYVYLDDSTWNMQPGRQLSLDYLSLLSQLDAPNYVLGSNTEPKCTRVRKAPQFFIAETSSAANLRRRSTGGPEDNAGLTGDTSIAALAASLPNNVHVLTPKSMDTPTAVHSATSRSTNAVAAMTLPEDDCFILESSNDNIEDASSQDDGCHGWDSQDDASQLTVNTGVEGGFGSPILISVSSPFSLCHEATTTTIITATVNGTDIALPYSASTCSPPLMQPHLPRRSSISLGCYTTSEVKAAPLSRHRVARAPGTDGDDPWWAEVFDELSYELDEPDIFPMSEIPVVFGQACAKQEVFGASNDQPRVIL
ncbi:hypothetical protein CYMTET_15132 [Cymbomonas tetramitiformis]|uniref:Uncharacterized protein n=1 Tax=Cymbomonas tetramitiformis TaxID=36881 RepID=A0AAE0GEL7_9CHLO|nr:hypothetical protein CYMTET_15132 [Cymbomonas tetramitiformis]